MKKLKKVANSKNIKIVCKSPFPDTVIIERDKEYKDLSDTEFRKKYRNYLYVPAIIDFPDKSYELQYNFCNNTFCKWYGLPQYKFDTIKSKPSRYKLDTGRANTEETVIKCNEIPSDASPGIVLGNYSATLSNWSIAEEIKRLVTINTVTSLEPEYIFHKEGCKNTDKTPFEDSEMFYKRGKSNTNSLKYQCKECKKITNILPDQDKCFTYHQKRNDIMVQLAKDIVSRTPVKRTCEKLGIGSSTYYNKLDLLYRKCLEFNQRHETEAFKNKIFDEIWLNTDMLIYYLNNIRRKGFGGKKDIDIEDKKMQTYAVASADLKTGYVFRADVAYDSTVNFDDIANDTVTYRCDHSYPFLRKNERLRYSYCPQSPTDLDSQDYEDYKADLAVFENRKKYVEGCHVKTQYTAMSHYFLIQKMLKAQKWYFISDDDPTLQSSIFRVFSNEFIGENAIYFTCQYDKSLTLQEAGKEAFRSRNELKTWAKDHKIKNLGLWEIAEMKLTSEVWLESLYDYKKVGVDAFPIRGNKPIKHPLPDKDEGIRLVNLINYVKYMSDAELARLVIQINNRAINNFFQEVRRKISILERPIVTSRGDGKCYIYANYNPKYAQQMLTIFRTFYNFCWESKSRNKKLTPAQRLGITDKVFDYKDIIYFR